MHRAKSPTQGIAILKTMEGVQFQPLEALVRASESNFWSEPKAALQLRCTGRSAGSERVFKGSADQLLISSFTEAADAHRNHLEEEKTMQA